jgi:hypothetical protein
VGMGMMYAAPARFVLLSRSPSLVLVQLDVPAGVVVRDVWVGFIGPETNIGPEGMDPGRVVDATPDGVGEGHHTYALDSVTGEFPIDRLPVHAGYTIVTAPRDRVGTQLGDIFWPEVTPA